MITLQELGMRTRLGQYLMSTSFVAACVVAMGTTALPAHAVWGATVALQASSGEPKHGEAVRRSLHALKGAAGLAGESVFADALGRLERRAATAPLEVSPSTLRLLETARARLVQGLPAAAA